jgi:dTDP-4-amino-4,6-dideoxygalactose transaminase
MRVPYRDLAWEYRQVQDKIDRGVHRVLESGRYLLGPELEAFEAAFAGYVGAKHCVGLGSGLDALRLTLAAWGIGSGDEVVVPAHTAVATWLAVAQTGAVPVPVDVDPTTFNLESGRIEAAISGRTRAIIPVHLYGQPADLEPILEIARRRELLVLEDAAQAHGARYLGRRVGSIGDAGAWSFYPTKNLGALGDAGAVTTDDDTLAARLQALRYPRAPGADRSGVAASSSRLDEVQAAVLRAKLTRLDEWNDRRRRNAHRYRCTMSDLDAALPTVPDWAEPVWHAFVVRSGDRDRLQHQLEQRGIATTIHYSVAPGAHSCFGDRSRAGLVQSRADQLARDVLSLPVGPELADDQVQHVIDAMRDFNG